MANFVDKTGRGQVNYRSPIISSTGKRLFLDHPKGPSIAIAQRNPGLLDPLCPGGILSGGRECNSIASHLAFQLRPAGSTAVEDVSNNIHSITKSGTITVRHEYVTHQTKLKTFEFISGANLTLSPTLSDDKVWIGASSGLGGTIGPTILPYWGRSQAEAAAQIIISGWINISSPIPSKGCCILETTNGTNYGLNVHVDSNGRLGFRMFNWAAGSNQTTSFVGLLTQKSLGVGEWFHFTIISGGFAGVGTGTSFTVPSSLYGTSNTDYDTSHIYINGIKQDTTDQTSSHLSAGSQTLSSPLSNSNFAVKIGTGLGQFDSSGPTIDTAAHFSGKMAEISYHYIFADQLAQAADNQSQNWRHLIAHGLFSGRAQPGSGYTNISERLRIRERDENSYHPTVSRLDIDNRLGKAPNLFDDSKYTDIVDTSSSVHYPTKLLRNDPLFPTIYAGYFDGQLSIDQSQLNIDTENSPLSALWNTYYTRASQTTHKPFIESKINIDDKRNFYLTGTSKNVIPGFSKRLPSKDIVQIRLNNKQDCQLGVAAGTTTTSYATNHQRVDFMAYFNKAGLFDLKEGPIHHGVGASNIPSFLSNLSCSCIGFTMNQNVFTSSVNTWTQGSNNYSNVFVNRYPNEYFSSFGKPTDSYGFPDDHRYESTGSNTILMSDYITEPFLVEKIVYEFPEIVVSLDASGPSASSQTGVNRRGFGGFIRDSSSGTEFYVAQTYGMQALNVFFLRDYVGNIPSGSKTEHTFAGLHTNSFVTGTVLESTTKREIVDYSNQIYTFHLLSGDPTFVGRVIHDSSNIYSDDTHGILSAASSSYGTPLDLVKQTTRLDIVTEPITLAEGANTLKNVKLESTVKSAVRSDFIGRHLTGNPRASSETAAHVLKWTGGPSNRINYISPRRIAKSVGGYGKSRNIKVSIFGGSNPVEVDAQTNYPFEDIPGGLPAPTFDVAPYVLLPEDKLIFGVQCDPTLTSNFGNPCETGIKISAGEIKITMYGSTLQNGMPKPSQINQQLNNDIVHESFGSTSIHDQFDVEFGTAFKGSIYERVISGSTLAQDTGISSSRVYNGFDGLYGGQTEQLARRIGGTFTSGNLGTTGSLKRNLSLHDYSRVELDSYLFDIQSIFAFDERTPEKILDQGRTSGSYINDYQPGTLFPNSSRPIDLALITADKWQKEIDGDPGILTGTIGNLQFAASHRLARYGDTAERALAEDLGDGSSEYYLFITGSEESIPGLIEMRSGSTAGAGVGWILGSTDSQFQVNNLGRTGNFTMSNLAMAKLFFGIGDGVQGAHIISPRGFSYSAASVAPIVLQYSGTLRGFRYGFSNIVSKFPSAVFRRDSYGQFRDLLEPMKDTYYIDQGTNLTTAAVSTRFVSNYDGSIVQPLETTCSNVSYFMTSSAPFFDRVKEDYRDERIPRNRGPVNNALVQVFLAP